MQAFTTPGWHDPGKVAATIALLGLAIYGLTYLLSSNFYAAFGLTPEDVAWSQTRAVARTGAFLVYVALLDSAIGVCFAVLLRVLLWFGRLLKVTQQKPQWPRWTKTDKIIAAALSVLGVAGAWYLADRAVVKAAAQIKDLSPDDIGFFPASVSGVDITLGQAVWAEAAPAGGALTQRSAVWYLGQANGSTVFFDLCLRQTVRVPSGTFVFQRPSDTDTAPAAKVTKEAAQKVRTEYCNSVGRPLK